MARGGHGGPGTRRGAKTRRRPPELPVRAIIAAAARAGWRHRRRTLAVAVGVSVVTALMEIVAHDLTGRTDVPLRLFTALTSSGVSLLGTVFLSGFLGRLVGEAGHGRTGASVWQVARSLRWRRLIGADLLVVLVVVIGFLALVIPGLVAMTLFAVVGPVIEIENRRVIESLRRSARLVRRHFWTVALLATLPLLAASEIESIIPHPDGAGAILAALAVRGIAGGLAEAAIGLTLVELCYRLIALDRGTGRAGRTPAAERRPAASSTDDHAHGWPRAADRGRPG